MTLQPDDSIQTPARRQPAVVYLLIAAVALIILATIAGVVFGVLLRIRPAESTWVIQVLSSLAWIMGGVGLASLLLALLCSLRGQGAALDQMRLIDQRLAGLAEQTMAMANQPKSTTADASALEIRKLLADIREILLLPDAQREARFRTMMQAEFRRRLALAGQFIDTREFHRAREELVSLAERFGRNDELTRMEERLLTSTRAALAEDVEAATRRISDLMAMTRWEHAEQHARELTQKYPDATEPKRLLVRVQEERKLFDQRHRKRMHEEIQQYVHQRRWREAASSADVFIQTFPNGVDTDALRQQVETLKANAEIEIRQQLERHIKEYIQRKDYWDALELARRIINEYPLSPQASALRLQLPRIEELARQQGTRA